MGLIMVILIMECKGICIIHMAAVDHSEDVIVAHANVVDVDVGVSQYIDQIDSIRSF